MEMKLKLILVLIGLLWTTLTAECWSPPSVNKIAYPEVNVTIENKLSDSSDVRVHCKSKDDDVGDRILGASGMYHFSFRPHRFVRNTLFFCGVTTRFGQVRFDVYEENRDQFYRCNHVCRWEVQNDGLVGYNDRTSKLDLQIPWRT